MTTHFTSDVHVQGVPIKGGNLWGARNVFYVNGTTWSYVGGSESLGSDNNPGTKEWPFFTITHALSQCSDDMNDVIYVLDYYQPSTETWPISVDKNLVSIIGLKNPDGGQFGGFASWCCAVASGNYPVFDIVASNVYISGFQLYAGTASYPCITMDDGASTVTIDHCRFCRGTYGLQLSADDTGYSINVYNSHFVSSLTTGGIYINDDTAFPHIAGNHFDRINGRAIHLTGGAGAVIEDNDIALGANTNGYAITLASSVARAYVNNNHCAYGAEYGTTTPYLDDGTVSTNNWGTNYFGKNAVDPG